MHWTTILASVGVALGILVNIPQAVKIFKNKNSKNVSSQTYMILFVTISCYLPRSIKIMEWPFIISQSCGLVITTVVLFLIYRYREG